jgi:hypothetical protein
MEGVHPQAAKSHHDNGQILRPFFFIQDSWGMTKAGVLKRVGRVAEGNFGTLAQIPRVKGQGCQPRIYGTLGCANTHLTCSQGKRRDKSIDDCPDKNSGV